MTPEFLLVALGSYLLGSIQIGLILGKLLKGVDIRDYGSGKTGTTNTLRTLGKGPAIAVLILDALKGVLPVLVARWVSPEAWLHVVAAVSAILGHDFPVWAGFRGGRGVSTSLGATAALMPGLAPVIPVLGGAILLRSGYASLASVLGTVIVACLIFALAATERVPGAYALYALIAASLILVLHRGNIVRLLAGTEPKFGQGGGRREPQSVRGRL